MKYRIFTNHYYFYYYIYLLVGKENSVIFRFIAEGARVVSRGVISHKREITRMSRVNVRLVRGENKGASIDYLKITRTDLVITPEERQRVNLVAAI